MGLALLQAQPSRLQTRKYIFFPDYEMTTLKRLGGPLPCHFALGRKRKLQGLAGAIIKLWERCEIVKIAVKRVSGKYRKP
ncbi:Chloroplastic group IIA intron splicing facilitator CRS1 [Spatholobus suberectus]|nr:Chloroplastic group IIA intron splicing facilitator CRS1 [Spatholobus suberectus]